MELIHKYFPELSEKQQNQFEQLYELYNDWNSKINVISRKDIEFLYLHHVLHSLVISKFIKFKPGTKIIDLGTGGGFPGVPLAIMFPEVEFLLVDSIQKKLKVIEAVSESIDLTNVTTQHARIEDVKSKADFIVTRAVAKVDQLLFWSRKLILKKHINAYPNGLIALKGNINDEKVLIPKYDYYEIEPISKYYDESYFEEKFILYVQL